MVNENETIQRNRQEVSFMYSRIITALFIGIKNEQDRKKDGFKQVALDHAHDTTFYPEFIERMEKLGVSPTDETRTLAEFCREQYKDNMHQLKLIDEFERNYNPNRSIWWYTRPTFLYEMLNKALRVQDIQVLYGMRFYIVDLHRKLVELHNNAFHPSSLVVYRGQGMSNEELEKLKQNCKGLLSINSFLSTTTDRQVALGFAQVHLDQVDYVAILFEICIDQTTISSTPFADISNESYLQGVLKEDEVLFSMGSIFRIESINKMSNGIWKVDLTMTTDEDEELRQLTAKILDEFNTQHNARGLGQLLFNMGDYEKAEYFYQIRLAELLNFTNEGSFQTFLKKTATQCKMLGIHFDAYDDYKKTCSHKQLEIAALYSDLGLTFFERYDYERALFYFQKVLQCEENQSTLANVLKAAAYMHMGLVYSDQNNYQNAMEAFYLAKTMMENDISTDPLHLAGLYYNIGTSFRDLTDYNEAIVWLEKALKIRLNHLPSIHPGIGLCYTRIGTTLALQAILKNETIDQNLLNLALKYIRQANYILKKTLPLNHRDLLQNQADLEFITGIAENKIQIKK